MIQWTAHPYLSQLFDDELLESIPTITTECGGTGYLDRVKPNDFIDENNVPVHMAKGIDQFDRHFVTMGLQVSSKSDPGDNRYYIYTLFRRYTETYSIWVMCISHYSKNTDFIIPNLLRYSMVVTNEAWEILKKLLQNYKNGNNGIELTSDEWDYEKNEYVKKDYIIKFYCPNNQCIPLI